MTGSSGGKKEKEEVPDIDTWFTTSKGYRFSSLLSSYQ